MHQHFGEGGGYVQPVPAFHFASYGAVVHLCPFQCNSRAKHAVVGVEAWVYGSALFLQYAHGDFDAGFAHSPDAFAVHLGIGVLHAYDYSLEAVFYNHVAAWGSLAPMGAWLQGNVHGASGEVLSGVLESIVSPLTMYCFALVNVYALYGIDFGMRTSVFPVVSLADDSAVAHYHCTHHGVGGYGGFSAFGQLYGSLHVFLVLCHRPLDGVLLFMLFRVSLDDVPRKSRYEKIPKFWYPLFCNSPTKSYLWAMNCLQELKRHYGPAEGYALYRMVMEECFGLSHTDILLGKDSHISEENQVRLDEITCRLLKNEPVQYILGYTWFCGHKFVVRPGALIPRPETELLVRKATELAHELAGEVVPSILDIGTGSGCIAISLALAGCRATAMDISEDALGVAMDNAVRLNADVEFLHENILHPSQGGVRWDVIVSNPPYICLHEAEEMERNVLDYEPHQALFVPDTDPLIFYRAIASYALSHLSPNGWICLEINQAFPDEMVKLLTSFGFRDTTIMQDQYGKARIAYAHL